MAEAVEVPDSPQRDPDEVETRPVTPRDRSILYCNFDGAQEFEAFVKALDGAKLSATELQSLDELRQYLVQGEGITVLGDEFIFFIERVLGDGTLRVQARVLLLRCLTACTHRDDVAVLLHQERRSHALLAYAHRVHKLPPPEQLALAHFICNLFEQKSTTAWLLYINKWQANGKKLTNMAVTTKVCLHCLLSRHCVLIDVGTALLYNISTEKLKPVMSVELCMAALKVLSWVQGEMALWRTVAALANLALHSPEVRHLVVELGPDPNVFRCTDPFVTEQFELLQRRVQEPP